MSSVINFVIENTNHMNLSLLKPMFVLWIFGYLILKFMANFIANITVAPRFKNKKVPEGVDKVQFLKVREYNMNKEMRELYKRYWNLFTRIMSTIHAFTCVSGVLYAYFKYNDSIFQFQAETDIMDYVSNINITMFTYLLVDCIFMIIERTETGLLVWTLHHTIGAIGTWGFAYYRVLPYNSLYFAFTEITTIFINLSWIILKFEIGKGTPKESFYNRLFLFICCSTWILWLIVRIVGSPLLYYMLLQDKEIILKSTPTARFLIIFANGAIVIMNLYWFYKISVMMLKQFRSKTDKSQSANISTRSETKSKYM